MSGTGLAAAWACGAAVLLAVAAPGAAVAASYEVTGAIAADLPGAGAHPCPAIAKPAFCAALAVGTPYTLTYSVNLDTAPVLIKLERHKGLPRQVAARFLKSVSNLHLTFGGNTAYSALGSVGMVTLYDNIRAGTSLYDEYALDLTKVNGPKFGVAGQAGTGAAVSLHMALFDAPAAGLPTALTSLDLKLARPEDALSVDNEIYIALHFQWPGIGGAAANVPLRIDSIVRTQ